MLQAWGGDRSSLVESGLALSEPDRERIVIKVPVTFEGTAAAAELIELGVRVCLTACYAKRQALVAVAVGAEYIAPYLGRMCDARMVSMSPMMCVPCGSCVAPPQPRLRSQTKRSSSPVSTLRSLAHPRLDSRTVWLRLRRCTRLHEDLVERHVSLRPRSVIVSH